MRGCNRKEGRYQSNATGKQSAQPVHARAEGGMGDLGGLRS